MAVKVPIVTTSVGGNIELIENGVSGLLVPFNDQRAMKVSILDILKDKTNTGVMVDKAYDKVCGFSVDKMVSSVSKVLYESK
jgi:glycosyltransferase involved in cell wall biosynthesis